MTLSPRLKYSSDAQISLDDIQRRTRDEVLAKIHNGTYSQQQTPCLCGATSDTLIAEKDRYGLPVSTVLCTTCGLMRSSPRLSKEATEHFYNAHYRDLYSHPMSYEDRFESEVMRGRHLVTNLPSLVARVESVYEVGCGGGGILWAFQECGKMVAGCDLGDDYLAHGRSKGLHLVHGRVEDLLHSMRQPADLVILSHVLEHFLDLRGELEAIIQAVKPGGFLLVDVPGIRSIEQRYRGDLLLYLQNAHTYHFSERTLRWLLEGVGLYVVAADESVIAVALRPKDWSPGAPLVTPPEGEALAIVSYLSELERKKCGY